MKNQNQNETIIMNNINEKEELAIIKRNEISWSDGKLFLI
jgi:hypothetical protein